MESGSSGDDVARDGDARAGHSNRGRIMRAILTGLAAVLLTIPTTAATAQEADPVTNAAKPPDRVVKTDAEWRKLLSPAQYLVTRMKATEPAFSGRYATGHYKGKFLCVCCGAELFDARTKFESGTGWPSFWRPINAKALNRGYDRSAPELRIEVTCARCGAHLGHVFNDGPPPTGLRFCINSLALKLDRAPARSAKSVGGARKTGSGTAKVATPGS